MTQTQLVIGPGAVGTVLVSHLTRAGHRVKLAVLDAHLPELEAAPEVILLRAPDRPGTVSAKPVISLGAELTGAQAVFICVKYPDLPAVLDQLPAEIPPGTTLVPCLNGVSAAAQLRERFPTAQVAPLTVLFNAQLLAPLQARLASSPKVLLHSQDTALLHVFGDTGLEVKGVRDESAAWGKLLLNLVSAICALTDRSIGDVLDDAALRGVYADAIAEAATTLEATDTRARLPGGIPLSVFQRAVRAGAATWLPGGLINPDAVPSMVSDLRRGRLTEVQQINGEIVRLAGRADINVPVNRGLVRTVEAAQQDASFKPLSVDQLLAELA